MQLQVILTVEVVRTIQDLAVETEMQERSCPT